MFNELGLQYFLIFLSPIIFKHCELEVSNALLFQGKTILQIRNKSVGLHSQIQSTFIFF